MQERPGFRSQLHHSFSNTQAMEQELGRQVCALGIVLLPSYILGEPRNEPGHKQEDEMEYYIAKQNQDSLPPVLS